MMILRNIATVLVAAAAFGVVLAVLWLILSFIGVIFMLIGYAFLAFIAIAVVLVGAVMYLELHNRIHKWLFKRSPK